jgi:ELWxxDGT repeat protein
MSPFRYFIACLGLLLTSSLFAQTPELIKDIYNGNNDSSPGYYYKWNDAIYFSARGYGIGQELFRYTRDGEVKLIKDIRPGGNWGSPINYIDFQNTLYFQANADDNKGTELFTYDGSVVKRVSDINYGLEGSYPGRFNIYKGKLVFDAITEEHGSELWEFDGTSYTRLSDIMAGSEDSYPSDFIVYNDTLFFTTDAPNNLDYLCYYDGINLDTLVSYNSNSELIYFQGAIYTSVYHKDYGYELAKYENGKFEILDLIPGNKGIGPDNITAIGDTLYFSGSNGFGDEPYAYDGNQFWMLGNINSGNSWSHTFYGYKGNVFFWALTDIGSRQVIKYDGTSTEVLKGIIEDPYTDHNPFVTVNDTMYFAGGDPVNGVELRKSDGDTIWLVDDINAGDLNGAIGKLYVDGVDILFAGKTEAKGLELWRLRTCIADYIDVYETACDSFQWKGKTYYESGVYEEALMNKSNCDSITYLNLTIVYPDTVSVTINACQEYDWNGDVLDSTGVYYDTLVSVLGCDSFVTLHLNVFDTISTTDSVMACHFYDWNGISLFESGVYKDTLSNMGGCDSMITLVLEIKEEVYFDTVAACSPFEWEGRMILQSGDYDTTYSNRFGCDSTLHLNLELLNNDSVIYRTECFEYSWNHHLYSESGVYIDTLSNIHGCDSIITLELTIDTLDLTISIDDLRLTANQLGAKYQWLDCDNDMAEISGKTARFFQVVKNGNYACVVSKDECMDTTQCVNIDFVGVYNSTELLNQIFPNPSDKELNINGLKNEYTLSIYSAEGKEIKRDIQLRKGNNQLYPNLKNGMYYLKLVSEQGVQIIRWVVDK